MTKVRIDMGKVRINLGKVRINLGNKKKIIIENVKPLCLNTGCSANCPKISFVKKVAALPRIFFS